MAQTRELVEFIAKKLVEHPEDVKVRVIENDEGQVLELRVHPDDMGKVIGRGGKTAKAIRSLLSSATTKSNTRAVLQIVE
ncbi:MAG: KH domain-containing protein [Candidatus Hydrogenedentes bacterium]|nr:KH domain-containing protein [Candidatus Hydrogenedentota bacterium]